MDKMKVEKEKKIYKVTNERKFNAICTFKQKSIEDAFDFAYDMSFGGKGKHRDHRSGGDERRKNGEIFANTFQGKLAEFGVYNEFYSRKINIPKPDLEKYDLGKWDKYDFKVNNKQIAVKSTKEYGNLLLLEKKDWDTKGEYKPNKGLGGCNPKYDYFILVRIASSVEDLMKQNSMLYSQSVDKTTLENLICKRKWKYDIPGFIDNDELVYAINNDFIIPKGCYLNSEKTKMDAENYYIQAGDMRGMGELFKSIKS